MVCGMRGTVRGYVGADDGRSAAASRASGVMATVTCGPARAEQRGQSLSSDCHRAPILIDTPGEPRPCMWSPQKDRPHQLSLELPAAHGSAFAWLSY